MIFNALWTGKVRDVSNIIAHVIALDQTRKNGVLVLYTKDDKCYDVQWAFPSGKVDTGNIHPLDLINFDIGQLKPNWLEEAISECNKEAIVLMASGKSKEKFGALACADRFKRLVPQPVPKYMVYDLERREWWGPNKNGYYKDQKMAGIYTEPDAKQIASLGNHIQLKPV